MVYTVHECPPSSHSTVIRFGETFTKPCLTWYVNSLSLPLHWFYRSDRMEYIN